MRRIRGTWVLILAVGVVLSACGGDEEPPPGVDDDVTPDGEDFVLEDELVLAEPTTVMDAATEASLVEFRDDGTLVFERRTPQLEDLAPGDVLNSGRTDAAPDGVLQVVTDVTEQDDRSLVVESEQGSLSDAFEQGDFVLQLATAPDGTVAYRMITPDAGVDRVDVPGMDIGLWDMHDPVPVPPGTRPDDVPELSCDNLDDVGSIEPDLPSIEVADVAEAGAEFGLGLSYCLEGSIKRLEARGALRLDQRFEAFLRTLQDEAKFSEDATLARFPIPGIGVDFPIGPIKLSLGGTIEIVVEARGEVTGEVDLSAEQTAFVQAAARIGLSGANVEGDAGFDFAHEMEISGPKGEVRASLAVEPELVAFGSVDLFAWKPSASVEAGASGSVYAQLDFDAEREPYCRLVGGLAFSVGFSGEIVGKSLGSIEEDVATLEQEIATCSEDGEEFDPSGGTGIKRDPDDQKVVQSPSVEVTSPADGTSVEVGETVTLGASTFLLACGNLAWSSSVAGDPLPVSGCSADVTFPSAGERVLTVSGTNSDGNSASADVTIEVVEPDEPTIEPTTPPPPEENLPPTVRITSPSGGAQVRHDDPVALVATAGDPDGDALSVEWTVVPVSDCPPQGCVDGGFGPQPVFLGGDTNVAWEPSSTYGVATNESLDVLLEFTALDSEGNEASDTVEITIYNPVE